MKKSRINIIIISIVSLIAIIGIIFLLTSKKDPIKNELTSFELLGDEDIYLLVNGTYNDPKAIATVNYVDYSANIKVSNTCDTTRIGNCKIVYSIDGFDKTLERNLYISDFSEWFHLDYNDSEQEKNSVNINVNIDKEKVGKYLLPNNTEKYDNDVFIALENGSYKFKIYDKYNNEYEKEITIEHILVKPIEAECKAVIKQNTTTISVKANKEISKYVYNDVESKDATYTFKKRIKTNKVVLYDNFNQNKEIVCNTTTEPFESFGEYQHVFIIGIDGLGATFSKVSSPNFDKIFKDYAYRHDVKTEYETVSAQNWASILTGVSYKTHGLTNDIISKTQRNSKSKNLSIFYYTRQKYTKANLVSIVNWNPINYGIIENDINVKKINCSNDTEVKNKIIDYLKNNDAPKLMFVQLDEVDHNAHTHGGFSKEYYNAAKDADTRLGEIYNTIDSLGLMKDSLFIVVADHGETTNGHGGQTKEESSALLAVRGYTVNKLTFNSNVQNRDVSAIALYALGIDKPSSFITSVPANLFGEPKE